ncbi:MAG TPA: hypothetical protein VGR65_05995 [Casimicrobiaceae bacterium]|nr:hypothetical protein [Casimicrobiaceae bacterium]
MDRESKSADEITRLINESVWVVPGLEKISVEVVRLPAPDAEGCNWIARYPALPAEHLAESARLLKDIIRNARRHFNLWDLH